jgi:hypothetical protein
MEAYIIHVHSDGATAGPDLGRSKEDVEASAAAKIDDGLALLVVRYQEGKRTLRKHILLGYS